MRPRPPYAGHVYAVCPTCDQVMRSEMVPGVDVTRIRELLQQVATAYRRWMPFARVKVFDPVAGRRNLTR